MQKILILVTTLVLTVLPVCSLAWSQGSTSEMPKIAEGLTEQVRQSGLIRVIVEPATPAPGSAEAKGVTDEEILAGTARVALMNSLPAANAPLVEPLGERLVVMEVTAKGLEDLAASPLVRRVEGDGLSAPQPVDPDAGDDGSHGGLDSSQ